MDAAKAGADGCLAGTIRSRTYAGAQVRYDVDCGLERLVSVHAPATGAAGSLREGVQVMLNVAPTEVMLFSGQDEDVEL